LINHRLIRTRHLIVGIVLALAVVACQGPNSDAPRGDAGHGALAAAATEARA
jgi:hypothetical protein